MSTHRTRVRLHRIARLLGDHQAVKKRRLGKRIARRVAGKAAGRGLGEFLE